NAGTEKLAKDIYPYVASHFDFCGGHMNEMLQDGKFRVNKADWVDHEGRRVVRLEILVAPKTRFPAIKEPVAGAMIMDPNRYWCCLHEQAEYVGNEGPIVYTAQN